MCPFELFRFLNICFLNVHEAIIDRATWEKVQALMKNTRRKRPSVSQERSAFSGLLKCPECGGNLNFHFNQNNHDIKFFSCQNHNSGLRKCSTTHYIRLDFLERVVLYEIKRLACFANEYEDAFIKAMVGRSAKVAENDRVRKRRELDALVARDKELDALFERLYEDKRNSKYIPYPKMIQYIALMDDGVEKLAEFNKVRQASTAQTNPTQFVNQWFKETFPNYKKPAKKAS